MRTILDIDEAINCIDKSILAKTSVCAYNNDDISDELAHRHGIGDVVGCSVIATQLLFAEYLNTNRTDSAISVLFATDGVRNMHGIKTPDDVSGVILAYASVLSMHDNVHDAERQYKRLLFKAFGVADIIQAETGDALSFYDDYGLDNVVTREAMRFWYSTIRQHYVASNAMRSDDEMKEGMDRLVNNTKTNIAPADMFRVVVLLITDILQLVNIGDIPVEMLERLVCDVVAISEDTEDNDVRIVGQAISRVMACLPETSRKVREQAQE